MDTNNKELAKDIASLHGKEAAYHFVQIVEKYCLKEIKNIKEEINQITEEEMSSRRTKITENLKRSKEDE